MIAVDTNVVVRLLTNDNPAQARKARALFESGQDLFVSPTVLLETEWVLRSGYGLAPARIVALLKGLLGLTGVFTAEAQQVASALDACAAGMDFADALHLTLSRDAKRFYTFDATLRRRATRLLPGSPPVVAP